MASLLNMSGSALMMHGVVKQDVTLSFASATVNTTTSTSTMSVQTVNSSVQGLTITYSSNDSSVATVTGTTITVVGEGTATITASFAGNETYNPASASYSLVVSAAVEEYLTFDILGNGSVGWKASNSSNTKTIQYRKNGGSWNNITSTTSGATISVANGDKLEFKADNTSIGSSRYYNYFTSTANFKVSGYLTSILDADGYKEYNTYGADNMFRYLFYNNTYLTDASGLVLPSTTRNGCYSRMFQGCTSLKTAPDLLAGNIATYAYYHLFDGCSSLNYVKCLATSGINTSSSTTSWLNGVASSGTFVKASAASWPSSTSGIPSGWTVQTAES